eukprot:scaffold120779_cov75-Phaeocystis_antarctica.AAC.2
MTELKPFYCCCCYCCCCCCCCPTILLARAAARRRAWHQSLGRSRPTAIGTVDLLDHGGPKAGEAWLARAAATEHEGGRPTPPTLFPSRPALLRCRRWVIRPEGMHIVPCFYLAFIGKHKKILRSRTRWAGTTDGV